MSTPTGSNVSPPRPGEEPPETESERRLSGFLIIAIVALIIGAALWLGDALIAARKADECISAGRRDCGPVSTPR